MGRGGRKSGRRKGGRRPVKRGREKDSHSIINTRQPPVVAKKPLQALPTLSSEDEKEEPTNYELLLSALGPLIKRPRIEEASKDEKMKEVAKGRKKLSKSRTKKDLSEAEREGDDSVSDVESEGDDGVSDVESEGDDGVSDVESEGHDGVSDVDSETDDGASDVESETDDGVSDVESEGHDGVSDVDSETDDGASDVESEGDDGVSDVESEGDDGVSDVESEVGDGSRDPFKVHFEDDLTEQEVETLEKVLSVPLDYSQTEQDPVLGSVSQASCLQDRTSTMKATQGKSTQELFIKSQLALTMEQSSTDKTTELTPFQQRLFSVMNSYKDLYFMKRTFENGEEIRKAYLVHALNHVLKTRSKVLKNNARLAQAVKTGKDVEGIADQGLTRPKVLILLPFRESALRTVNMMIQLLLPQGDGQVSHRKRFQEEFSEEEHLPPKTQKPKSYNQMFAGNIDDCFRVGVALRRKSVCLYSEFYSSDIILASPLGLRTIIGAEGDKKRDYDFLSSLEIIIMDQSDVFLMQNWDHVLHIFSHLHLQPKDVHGVDISRLRNWTINGWSKFYRQTLIFSSLFTPEINSLLNSHSFNYAGKVKVNEGSHDGSVGLVAIQAPQVFHRIHCQSHRQLAEARFSYFVENILPEHCGELMKQTVIFIPSYFDFVRVRNHMKRQELSCALLSEYTRTSEVSRNRSWFFHKQRHFLLFTERLHFFRRYNIRGTRHIIFYSLPLYSEFYPEIVNMLEGAGQMGGVTCTVLYSRYELHLLSRIVGNVRAQRMLESDEHIHMLVTGT